MYLIYTLLDPVSVSVSYSFNYAAFSALKVQADNSIQKGPISLYNSWKVYIYWFFWFLPIDANADLA